MYPSDFSSPDAAYAPVDGPLFLGLPPMLATMLALLLLAVAAAMFLLGRWHAGQAGDTDAERVPEDIHKAILAASTAAMAASSDDLKSRAKALRTAIEDHLGPVLVVGKGVNGPVKALDEALKGEVKEKKEGHGGPAGHEKPHATAGCTCGQPTACTCGRGNPASVTINQVYVGGMPVSPAPGCGCAGSHRPGCDQGKPDPDGQARTAEPVPETRAMTGPEQVDALSRAVRAFHDHWSRRPERIAELRAARAVLSRR